MKALNLMLHAGGSKVDRNELSNVITPPATDSWQPVPHAELLDAVGNTLTRSGMTIISEAHGLAREGARYFGLLQVANGHNAEDYSLVVGLRNSHDKSFPAGLCVGSGVFVCDNLAFNSEIVLSRKHTRFITRDLVGLVDRAVGILGDHRQQQDNRIAAYKTHGLTDAAAHDVLINAMDARIIGTCQLPKVLEQWRAPKHDDFRPRTAWSIFNAFTEIIRGNAETSLIRTQRLHGLMDSVCGIALAV